MTSSEQIEKYLKCGFVNTKVNNSGLATTVMFKGKLVVRIGYDERYSHFAMLVLNKQYNLTNVVNIYSHESPLGCIGRSGATGTEYTVTLLELLDELTSEEADSYSKWVCSAICNIRSTNNACSSDSFGLLNDITILYNYAIKNRLGLDFINPKNIMKRGDVFVHIDPFG